jgi:hypothetical protein
MRARSYNLPIYGDLLGLLKHQPSQLTAGGWRIEEPTLGEVREVGIQQVIVDRGTDNGIAGKSL